MQKTNIQLMLCVFTVSSSVIAYYWVDTFMFPCGIALLVQAIPFILVALYVPKLFWNLAVVFLYWFFFTLLDVINIVISCQDWVNVGQILWNRKWSTTIVVIGIYMLFQLFIYFMFRKATGDLCNVKMKRGSDT